MQKLLIATHNAGKVREYRELLADLAFQVLSLDEAGITHDVAETGSTFEENAILKARTYAAMAQMWTWADDSGLVVDALGGQPGVYSARYGGPGLDDAGRIDHLLNALGETDLAPSSWTARFHCVVALALPDGTIRSTEGSVEGVITPRRAGDNGFGYDPIFYLPDQKVTMAQLTSEEKNRISHRGQAARAAKIELDHLLAAS